MVILFLSYPKNRNLIWVTIDIKHTGADHDQGKSTCLTCHTPSGDAVFDGYFCITPRFSN